MCDPFVSRYSAVEVDVKSKNADPAEETASSPPSSTPISLASPNPASRARPARSEPNHAASEPATVIPSVVPSSTLYTIDACDAASRSHDDAKLKQHQKLLVQSKSLAIDNRPIYPNCPYSPYGSPTNSPRNKKKQPFRESRRISMEKTGMYIQLNQYKLMDSIGQVSARVDFFDEVPCPIWGTMAIRKTQ